MFSPLRTGLLAALLFLVLAPAARAWTWPASGPVLEPFRLGNDPYAGGQHRGIDVAGAAGSPVAAPRAGTVSYAGSMPTNGLCVTIATADGYSVTLVHLGSIAVRKGAQVAEGAVVGTIGPTGVAAHPEPYVFMGVRVTTDPNGSLAPLPFLPARPVQPPPPAPKPAPSPSPQPTTSVPAPTPAAPAVADPNPLPADPEPAPPAEPGPVAAEPPAAVESPVTDDRAADPEPPGADAAPVPGITLQRRAVRPGRAPAPSLTTVAVRQAPTPARRSAPQARPGHSPAPAPGVRPDVPAALPV